MKTITKKEKKQQMKKLVLLILIIEIIAIFSACDSDVTEPTATQLGNAYFTSTPVGAQIWIDSKDTKIVTPDTVKLIEKGLRVVNLKLTGYMDTTFLIDIEARKTIIANQINLVKN